MDTDGSLTVRVGRRGDKYTWELHRDGRFHPVKFSAPVYASEEAARAAGQRSAERTTGPSWHVWQPDERE